MDFIDRFVIINRSIMNHLANIDEHKGKQGEARQKILLINIENTDAH